MSQELNPQVVPSAKAERRRNRRDVGVLVYGLVVAIIAAAILAVTILA